MNKKKQGDVGVAMAIAHYTKLGYVVCYPLTDSARYDLVVDIDGELKRVQCKSTNYIEKSSYVVNTKTCGGNQSWNGAAKVLSKDECDLLFVYVFDGSNYEFPPEIFDGKGKLTLGKKLEQYRI